MASLGQVSFMFPAAFTEELVPALRTMYPDVAVGTDKDALRAAIWFLLLTVRQQNRERVAEAAGRALVAEATAAADLLRETAASGSGETVPPPT